MNIYQHIFYVVYVHLCVEQAITIIGSRLQVRTRIGCYYQPATINSDRRLTTDFPSRWCCLGKLWLGTSKDSSRKASVRKMRKLDVAVNWLNFELVVGKGRWPPSLRESCQRETSYARKADFQHLAVAGGMYRDCQDKDYLSLWRTLAE